jgi:lipoprotein-anchoring transpeptidase ErfK/SrfK
MLKKIKFYVFLVLVAVAVFLAAAFGTQKYVEIFRTAVVLQKNSNIVPGEPVVLNFSRPVLTTEAASRIAIDPTIEVATRWSSDKKQLIIEPEKFWLPETDYKIFFPGARSAMLTKIPGNRFFFSTVAYPDIFGVYPRDGQKDVFLDIEDPIVVDFDKSARGFFMKFVLDPDPEMTYFNNSEKTQFKLMPKRKLAEGQKYNLKIYAKYEKAGDESFKLIHQESFETLPPSPASWEKNFALRLEQAKRFTRPKIVAGKYIDINLSQQIMSTFENGRLLDSYLISSGKRGMDTPKGEHKIYNKSPRPWSKKYSLYMPFWMAITSSGSYGIHELPEWPGGYKEGANHLGTPVSHGCVRLGIGPAKTVFDWADIGTPVVIY